MPIACQPTRSRWWTIEVKRCARGRMMVRPSATANTPMITDEIAEFVDEARRRLADFFHLGDRTGPLRLRARRLPVGGADLVDQSAIAVGHRRQFRLAAGLAPLPHQPLDQPGAEGVQPLYPGDIDLGVAAVGGRLRHQRAQRIGLVDGPRSAGREPQPVALGGAAERWSCAHWITGYLALPRFEDTGAIMAAGWRKIHGGRRTNCPCRICLTVGAGGPRPRAGAEWHQ